MASDDLRGPRAHPAREIALSDRASPGKQASETRPEPAAMPATLSVSTGALEGTGGDEGGFPAEAGDAGPRACAR